ncbi:hypothetical protein EDC01DRAFT_726610 [Geopyxis carbonaria]|nr:hypothetical protein EDC01DRAFT_726610 [Geopyxis carbonaria]
MSLRPRLLRPLAGLRTVRLYSTSPRAHEIPYLPRILQPTTYVPSWSGRWSRSGVSKPAAAAAKPWNPATFFIWIFMLIGSNSINLLTLKQEHAAYMRGANAHLDTLREVIEKLSRGEKVDVAAALGTGDERAELEWEAVVKELEKEDLEWREKLEAKKRGQEERRVKAEREKVEKGERRRIAREKWRGGEGKQEEGQEGGEAEGQEGQEGQGQGDEGKKRRVLTAKDFEFS